MLPEVGLENSYKLARVGGGKRRGEVRRERDGGLMAVPGTDIDSVCSLMF